MADKTDIITLAIHNEHCFSSDNFLADNGCK